MKINLQLMKAVIRLLILLILFVMLFIISAFLYSAKYWPDVYTYINANITIKRIPTISELNITIFEISESVTEISTTDFTDTTNIDDFTDNFEDFFQDIDKRQVKIEDMTKDYLELPKNVVINYVFDIEDDTKVIKDLVDESKLTTINSNDVEMVVGVHRKIRDCADKKINDTTNPGSIFPWIATIFIKNSSNSQFDYYCDGVLLSETVVITAARCLLSSNVTVNADDVLVFLGKTSLLSSGEGEEIHKVKRLTLHENFTSTPEVTSNDLAALQLENPAVFNERIQAACLLKNGESSEAITTAWDASLSPIRFVEKNKTCEKNPTENTFCATFGNNVALCPSYGGVYASLSSESWCVQGLRMADPTSTGYCLEKTIAFTDLRKYSEWIDDALNKELF